MFKLFDREETFLHDFEPISAKNKEKINDEDILTLELTGDIEIEKKYRILAYVEKYQIWKEYIVEEIEENRTEGTKEVYAENSLYETLGDYIEDKRAVSQTANIALERAIETTRWELGIIDNLGESTASFYRISVMEAIHDITVAWKCEIQTRIELVGNEIAHRYIDLLAERGSYLGERFVTGENIEKITKTTHSDQVITALYGYGKGEEVGEGHGRRIDFSEINDGKAYVEDNDARLIWGRPNQYGTKAHIFGKVEFDDIEDPQELLAATTLELEKLSVPKITYEGEVIGSVARLGDTVALIDETYEPELRLTARVYEIENDLLSEGDSKPVLGNFINTIADEALEQKKLINNFRDKQGIWDRSDVIGSDGRIDAQYLNNLIDELNTKMNSLGGYVFISDEGEGLITYDAPTAEAATMAIHLLGGSFRIANSKDSDGNWDWRTFGDGNGFIADSFIGGVLKGGDVYFDLTNGTLRIGESLEDYTFFYDGTDLFMNGQIKFTDGGQLVAWINGQQLLIRSAVIENDLALANHMFEADAGGTTLSYIGEG